MKSYNNHRYSHHSKNQQKNNTYNTYRKNKYYQSRNKSNFSEQKQYQNNYSNGRHDSRRSFFNSAHHQSSQNGPHISFKKQFLRALFGILSALGFGAFWYALSQGIQSKLLIFVFGIFLVLNVFLHLFFVIKKQIKNKHT